MAASGGPTALEPHDNDPVLADPQLRYVSSKREDARRRRAHGCCRDEAVRVRWWVESFTTWRASTDAVANAIGAADPESCTSPMDVLPRAHWKYGGPPDWWYCFERKDMAGPTMPLAGPDSPTSAPTATGLGHWTTSSSSIRGRHSRPSGSRLRRVPDSTDAGCLQSRGHGRGDGGRG